MQDSPNPSAAVALHVNPTMATNHESIVQPNVEGDSPAIPWTNDNWRLVSKALNVCRMSEPEGDFFLATLRMIDFTKSIPPNVRAVRNFEKAHLGHTM